MRSRAWQCLLLAGGLACAAAPAAESAPAQATAPAAFMLLKTPPELARRLARSNPEAASVLLMLEQLSRGVSIVPLAKGEAMGLRAPTETSVAAVVDGQSDPTSIEALMLPLPEAAASSRVRWALEPDDAASPRSRAARLRISHELLNAAEAVVARPYRDVAVALDWVASPAGGGYWLATGWQELP